MSSLCEAPHFEKEATAVELTQLLNPTTNGHSKEQLATPEQPLIDLSDHEGQVTTRETPGKDGGKLHTGGREVSKAEPRDDNDVKPEEALTTHPNPDDLSNQVSEVTKSNGDSGTAGGSESIQSTQPEKSTLPPPPPPPKDEKYLAATLLNEKMQQVPFDPEKEALQNQEMDDTTVGEAQMEDIPDDSRSEIQNIMTQFQEGDGGPGESEIMSPRLEIAQPMFTIPQHPPRKSSLEPINPGVLQPTGEDASSIPSPNLQSPPPRTSSLASVSSSVSLNRQSISQEPPEQPLTPQMTKHLPPPPQPDPEPDLPFDFHRFLEQLRHRSADPVARFLRSFLLEFGKKQWMVHEQVKIISDFLEFISKKMALCEVWQAVSDAEFDNAREGMEKLVMNRLYNQTFSPAIPPPQPIPGSKGRKRGAVSPTRPGRRGQHQEDVERDQVLAQKVRIYGWVQEEHLDIKPIGDKGKKFMSLAQQELLKINSYRAPRDKVICILNCCKVIFGFLRNTQHDESADSFVPLLIYVVLHANPENLVSNVQYILRFRNQDKLGGEAGYYISSLMGTIQFIENLDRTSLTISDADFERHVEAAVSLIAEKHSQEESKPPLPSRHTTHANQLPVSEKATPSRAEVTPRTSLEAEPSTHRRGGSLRNGSKTDSDDGEEMAAMTGLLKSIQRPLSTIGRIFSDDTPPSEKQASGLQPPLTPQPARKLSPASSAGDSSSQPRRSTEHARQQHQQQQQEQERKELRQKLSAEDAAARQASAEAEEARKLRVREEANVVETLSGMFPGLDKDVIMDVVRANEGRVGSAVDACLALSS